MFWKKRRERKRGEAIIKDFVDRVNSVQPNMREFQKFLPPLHKTWNEFWNTVKEFDTIYIIYPQHWYDPFLVIDVNKPGWTWKKEHIRQRAIREATLEENYELAAKIKNE